MAIERRYSMEHITHPGHTLTYFEESAEFICDGCNQFGNGTSYRCVPCDFVLHEHCATCPAAVSFAAHPRHKLNLVSDGELFLKNHVCDVCGTQVEGLHFYRCELCNFDAHPLYTQLSELTRHHLHPDHLLRLQPLWPGRCHVCQTTCAASWGYGCQVCGFNIHLSCINSPVRHNWSSFLGILKSPIAILLVLTLAIFVVLVMSKRDQRQVSGYSVHSVYYHR